MKQASSKLSLRAVLLNENPMRSVGWLIMLSSKFKCLEINCFLSKMKTYFITLFILGSFAMLLFIRKDIRV